ncbi:TBC1 domain family member 20 [Patella vulgata]|uniref:TBC1 domain family member 20 n=1 Tax=Patella vulgata TaxID=6465 RepID=UPI0021801E4B|nr:TBC1 domain family member 20 [Patella vulgata]
MNGEESDFNQSDQNDWLEIDPQTEIISVISPDIVEPDVIPPKTEKDDKNKNKNVKLSPGSAAKRKKILRALKDGVDVSELQSFAINRGGLLTNELRKQVWPKQLGVKLNEITPKPAEDVLHGHRDYEQVVMDVNRSLKRFPPGMDDDERFALQDILVDVIMRVLVNNSELHYYQGFHDICVTFLLVVDEDVAFAIVEKLSQKHLRDFMDVDMDRTKHMLNYLYPIIDKASPQLCEYMERAETGTIFCLSWLITWYGHVLNDIKHIVRLYDFFIACHQLMPIYLAAAIVLYRQDEILETECEMCFIHSLLSRIPDNLPFEQLISKAGDLYLQFPPEDLASEAEFRSQENDNRAKRQRANGVAKLHRWSWRNNIRWVSTHMPNYGRRHYLLTTAVAAVVTAALCYSTTDWGWIEWSWF